MKQLGLLLVYSHLYIRLGGLWGGGRSWQRTACRSRPSGSPCQCRGSHRRFNIRSTGVLRRWGSAVQ